MEIEFETFDGKRTTQRIEQDDHSQDTTQRASIYEDRRVSVMVSDSEISLSYLCPSLK